MSRVLYAGSRLHVILRDRWGFGCGEYPGVIEQAKDREVYGAAIRIYRWLKVGRIEIHLAD